MLTDEQVKERIAEIEELEAFKKHEEKKYERLIRQVEAKITQVEHDKNIWAIKLKEKDQEFRLNELRIKELKRQVPHKALKPLPTKENSKNQKKRNQKPPVEEKLKSKKTIDTGTNKSKVTKQTSMDNKKKEPPKADKKETSIQAKHEEEEEPYQSQKIGTKEDSEEEEMNNRQSINKHYKQNLEENEESEDEEKRDASPDQMLSPPYNKNEQPSRLSNDSKKDGFYDNSFLEEKEEQDEKPSKNLKTKPFTIGAKQNKNIKEPEDDEDNYDNEDYEEDE